MKINILNKEYSAEFLNDIFEDIHWEIENLQETSKDKDGFDKGAYKLVFTYEENE